jgi:hypothetical protein
MDIVEISVVLVDLLHHRSTTQRLQEPLLVFFSQGS